MNKHIKVIPLSNKAKNRLANTMNNDSVVLVEREDSNEIFCASSNRNYFFWVSKVKDTNWKIDEDYLYIH